MKILKQPIKRLKLLIVCVLILAIIISMFATRTASIENQEIKDSGIDSISIYLNTYIEERTRFTNLCIKKNGNLQNTEISLRIFKHESESVVIRNHKVTIEHNFDNKTGAKFDTTYIVYLMAEKFDNLLKRIDSTKSECGDIRIYEFSQGKYESRMLDKSSVQILKQISQSDNIFLDALKRMQSQANELNVICM